MERISIFDIFKIGIGPSSSHTLGPWKAANLFAEELKQESILSIDIHLFGSLSKTGIGHGTDIAVMLGLEGYLPETINSSKINDYILEIEQKQRLVIHQNEVFFIPKQNIVFFDYAKEAHPNTLTFKAMTLEGKLIESTFYSVGGGFIIKEGDENRHLASIIFPFPIDKGEELLNYTQQTGLKIAEIVLQNELSKQDEPSIRQNILKIFDTMLDCAYKGCHAKGVLPGGLNVKRRAFDLHQQLLPNATYSNAKEWLDCIRHSTKDFAHINRWISCFALAVNEENASLGRVVTSPTNGAAGVIPAVLLYYYCFADFKGDDDIVNFFLTSGEIGSLFKKGATISAAVGGCQAEIGVSSAMAAGGLTELLGGTPEQVLMAAEIAMEHHLGLTCDPIKGLVQIPCIERNAMGAIKAITASHLALHSNPKNAIVNFDAVVKTMWDTAQDMNNKYKETAEGGLAINLSVILPNC